MSDTADREQRTEEATPRRREEARERGQVALSTELVAAVGLAAGAGIMATGGGNLAHVVADVMRRALSSLSSLGTRELSLPESATLLSETIHGVLGTLAMMVVPTVLVCALTGFVQIGFRLSSKAIEMDPSKLDPMKGLGKLFSLRGLSRTGFSLAKILLITVVAATVAWMHVEKIVHAGINELGPLLAAVGVVVMRTTSAVLIVILLLGVLDTLVQRFQLSRDLRMTKAEVKEEHRLTEGDPHVRARIRSVQREFAMRRMMADVPKATVVVTNPTHFAVALRYEREGTSGERHAPVVVAKGVDHLAERIKQIARDSGVPCHEDVPLARALHARVAIGQEIPEELYAAVAAVLATVYRLQEAQVA